MSHSNQMREFLLTDQGIRLLDIYAGPGSVLTGSARLAQEARDRQAEAAQAQAIERRQRELQQERSALEAQLRVIQAKLEVLGEEVEAISALETDRLVAAEKNRQEMAASRKAD
jgi:circadian clock protein KaiC